MPGLHVGMRSGRRPGSPGATATERFEPPPPGTFCTTVSWRAETFRTCDLCASRLNSFPNQSWRLSGHRMNPRCGVILILPMGNEVMIFALGEPAYLA
jgi:hypothetical protein